MAARGAVDGEADARPTPPISSAGARPGVAAAAAAAAATGSSPGGVNGHVGTPGGARGGAVDAELIQEAQKTFGQQGEGAIEGSYLDYIVGSLGQHVGMRYPRFGCAAT